MSLELPKDFDLVLAGISIRIPSEIFPKTPFKVSSRISPVILWHVYQENLQQNFQAIFPIMFCGNRCTSGTNETNPWKWGKSKGTLHETFVRSKGTLYEQGSLKEFLHSWGGFGRIYLKN